MKEHKLFDLNESEIIIPISGKIIKVFVEFSNEDGLTDLNLFTKEGEEILNIQNIRLKDIFYPRINTIIGRYKPSTEINIEGLMNLDYFYSKGFFLKIKRNAEDKERLIKKILILYE